MTKKHFEIIARVIATRVAFQPDEIPALRGVAESMASEFARVNPRFNRSRFFAACSLH